MSSRRLHYFYGGLVAAAVFGAGLGIGRLTAHAPHTTSIASYYAANNSDYTEDGTTYTFINPLLFCQDSNLSNQGANQLEATVNSYISSEKANGDISDAAFYFRDLNGGPWALVNPDYRSAPASLLKVPLAISVYQRAEIDPTFLSKKIVLPADMKNINADAGEHYAAQERVMPNTPYTVEDLVELMLKYSDNTALYLLGNLFTVSDLQNAYTHLGIEAPSDGSQGYTISVKTFASFFRVLYNGTYLSQDNSEHVLSLLSQSTFTQGIVAGVPTGTVVAHKFGENTSAVDGTRQLNDCGIIYKPDQPYLLCVMTTGTSFDTLAHVISHISNIVYTTLAAPGSDQ